MNGAERLMQTAADCGIEICFANPGTTELPLVGAFDSAVGLRAVLAPFEGCCTGAADGYGRMTDTPAMTLLHLGPGLANGLANLHNARRAHTPVVNVIGDHATWHLPADPPLAMDIEALAGTVSGWRRTTRSPGKLPRDMADAVTAALAGQVATLIVPHDHQWEPDVEAASPPFKPPEESVDPETIERTARLLKENKKTVLILGGRALRRRGQLAAAAIRDATGCDLLVETMPARMDREPGLPFLTRAAYFPRAGLKMFAPYNAVILAGAREPISFFGYRDWPTRFLQDDCLRIDLTPASHSADLALIRLAETLGLNPERIDPKEALPELPGLPSGNLDARSACAVLAVLQPENAIIVDEGITSGGAYYPMAAAAAPHSWLTLTGGSLGQGMPCAVGAAMACPDRPVINLQADGSGLYTVQSLWMQAREGLNITTLLCANRSYDILKIELLRAGYKPMGPVAQAMTDLGRGAVDWVGLSRGFGVPAAAVDTAEDLVKEMQTALAEPGPHLICMNLPSAV